MASVKHQGFKDCSTALPCVLYQLTSCTAPYQATHNIAFVAVSLYGVAIHLAQLDAASNRLYLSPCCRQQSSSPATRGAYPTPAPASAPQKQKASPSASQALHRQTVVSQATRQQAGKAGTDSDPGAAQPSILPKSQGNVLAAANGQAVASGADSKIDSKGSVESLDKMGSGPQRTDSGKMLNPFASTFIPRTASGNVLSTSASSSQ